VKQTGSMHEHVPRQRGGSGGSGGGSGSGGGGSGGSGSGSGGGGSGGSGSSGGSGHRDVTRMCTHTRVLNVISTRAALLSARRAFT
jgi:hypothetical protein